MAEIIQIGDRVWARLLRLGGESHVAMYLVKGDAWALIDTGIKFPADDPRMLSRRALEVVPGFDDLDLVLLTHGHYDHVGGVAGVRAAFPNAEVYMHPADAPMALSPRVQGRMMSRFARDWGLDRLATEIEDFVELRMESAEPDHELRGGTRVQLGAGMDLEVIDLPGHTAGSVGLHLASDDVTFVGDAVQGWGSRVGSWPLYSDPTAYRASLASLAERRPGRLAMAHGYQCGLPFNRLVLEGTDVEAALELSMRIVGLVDRELAGLQTAHAPLDPVGSAQRIVRSLLHEVPAREEVGTGLPNHAGMTLRAHGLGADLGGRPRHGP